MQLLLLVVFIKYIAIICIEAKSKLYPSIGCGSSVVPQSNSTTEQFLSHNDIERSYLIHLPSAYVHLSAEGHPLILNLHGFTEFAWQRMIWSGMNQHSEKHNYIAVYPQGTSYGSTTAPSGTPGEVGTSLNLTSWNDLGCSGSPGPDGPTCIPTTSDWLSDIYPEECTDVYTCNFCNCNADDIGFIDKLLDELESKYCIDRSRVYITGFSNGGGMTHRLGCELNHRLAAIAPSHGAIISGFNCKPKSDLFKMPILMVWGTNDLLVPGDTTYSAEGNKYYHSVYQVMFKYGLHNKCNINKGYSSIPSVSDGINEWQCIGYDECDFDEDGNKFVDVMSCSWNGTHFTPHVFLVNGEWQNIQLNVIWNFFKKYSKIPHQEKRHKHKHKKHKHDKHKRKQRRLINNE